MAAKMLKKPKNPHSKAVKTPSLCLFLRAFAGDCLNYGNNTAKIIVL